MASALLPQVDDEEARTLAANNSDSGCPGSLERKPWRGKRLAAAVLSAVLGLVACGGFLAKAISHGAQSGNWAEALRAYNPGNNLGRFVETGMHSTVNLYLDMNVRMIGLQTEHGHVVGHLAEISNPGGRVSLALPAGGCGHRAKTSVTAVNHYPRCRLAVNAGYFNVTNGACIGNLVEDGRVVQTVPLEQSNVNFGIKSGNFAIGYFTPAEVAQFEQLVSGVVWLVRDGKEYVKDGWSEANITVQTSGNKYATNLASRTAVGWDKDGVMMILQVDGSIAVGHQKRGLSMSEMARLLIHHGAVNAINLDGGGSSAMVLDGVLINYPSDTRPPSCDDSGDFQCERPVSTVLCIHELPGVIV